MCRKKTKEDIRSSDYNMHSDTSCDVSRTTKSFNTVVLSTSTTHAKASSSHTKLYFVKLVTQLNFNHSGQAQAAFDRETERACCSLYARIEAGRQGLPPLPTPRSGDD